MINFEKNLGYNFKDKKLLELALTQSGFDASHNNEKLEFLGDRVLGLSVASLLYETFCDESEGALAQRFAVLVSADVLVKVGAELGMREVIKHSHMTTDDDTNIVADAVEAVFGAVYLEAGFEVAQKIIKDIFIPLCHEYKEPPKDPKTKLQEFVQTQTTDLPEYVFDEVSGPAHSPIFRVSVSALGKKADGEGNSKKHAMRNAAENLLKLFNLE